MKLSILTLALAGTAAAFDCSEAGGEAMRTDGKLNDLGKEVMKSLAECYIGGTVCDVSPSFALKEKDGAFGQKMTDALATAMTAEATALKCSCDYSKLNAYCMNSLCDAGIPA